MSKQFTYAKNVIQYGINSELNGYSVHSQNKTRYRDELTDGYNITPNFFITAVIDKDYDAARDNIQISGKPDFQCQFKNRLFDRDTLATTITNLEYGVENPTNREHYRECLQTAIDNPKGLKIYYS